MPYSQLRSIFRLLPSIAAIVVSSSVFAQMPSDVGEWGDVLTWPHVAVSMANLPDGRILTWSGSERRTWPSTEQTYSATWNPASNEFIEYFFEGHNMFCAHLAMTEDGGVFVNGGRNTGNSPWTTVFRYEDNQWQSLPNMASGGRWYPTTLALGDGTIFTAMGNSTNVRNPDLWDPQTGWRILNGIDFINLRQNNNELGRENVFPLLSLAPSGEIFHFWDTQENHLIDISGNGSSRLANSVTDGFDHAGGIQLMYDAGKLLISGANDGSWGGNSSSISNNAFTVDLNGPAPVIMATDPMNYPRKFHQMISLPTGEALVVGGNTTGVKFQDNGSVMPAEIWNPDNGQWREVAALTIPRDYHSTAILLTDGRVLTAGGGYHPNNPNSGGTHQNAQIFSPPYLFTASGALATRPQITSDTGSVLGGDTLTVSTQGDIASFSMIKMSATTHALNTDARFYRPVFTAIGGGQYDIQMHPNPNVAVPGYWMLFAIDTAGVPSLAQVIRVLRDGAPLDDLRNLAPDGTATQSSTFPSALDFEAKNAIDGNLNGVSASGSLTHTLNQLNEWWEVDLGDVFDLNSVRLWNRTDCCADRLTNFHVLVSDIPFTSSDLADTLEQPDVGAYNYPGVVGTSDTVDINRTGRYVRVQMNGAQYLQLAEVQVFGRDRVTPGENIAPMGFATQSSTFPSGLNFDAQNAIDGNTNGNSNVNSITHTLRDVNAWWEVDLGGVFDIDSLMLWNRTDCCANRLSNFHVFVSDVPFGSTDLALTQAQVGVSDFGYPGVAGESSTFAINRSGRYLRVQLAGQNYLQLAEVQIFAAGGSNISITPVPAVPSISNQTVNFTASASGGNGAIEYNWNFGDGSADSGFSTNPDVVHTYAGPGRYVVSLTVRDASGNETRETFTHVVHLPLTPVQPKASSGLVEHASRQQLWSVNPDNDSVSVISTHSLSLLSEIEVGTEPRALALAANNELWVVNKSSATISIIDTVSLALVRTLNLPSFSQPHGIVIEGSTAFVALEGAGAVVRLDTVSGAVVGQGEVGAHPRHLSLDAEGRLFVSRFITPPLPGEHTASMDVSGQVGGEVRILNPQTLQTESTIVLRHINRDASEHEGPGVPNYLGAVAISPDGSQAWVPSKQDNVLAGDFRGGDGITFDQTVRAVTSRIRLPGGMEDLAARIDHDNASVASAAVFGPLGTALFTSLEGNRQIALSDANTFLEIARFDVGLAPQSLALSVDGERLYVHNFMDRSIGVYDIRNIIQFGATIATELAVVRTVVNEALAVPVFRGKQLFYDARDDRLAALDYMSCASCHNEGGHDGRTWDFSSLDEGLRNTTTLKGKAGLAHGFLHWTGNFDEVQDFEGQIRAFAGGSGLMSDSDFFAGTRSLPLGDPKAFISPDLDALSAYLASLDEVPRSPEGASDGNLSATAQAGAQLFGTLNCASCHSGPAMTDSNLHDIGTLTAFSGLRLGQPVSGIDTPTLNGLFATAPYLHDGSALTVEEAISAHSGVSTTPVQRVQLAAYLAEVDPQSLDVVLGEELLINGDLEAGRTSGWGTVASLSGWQSSNQLEVWASGHAGVSTLDGGNLVEIDYIGAGGVDAIWQDVATTSGARYLLSLQLRSRGDAFTSSDEAICIEWQSQPVDGNCFNASGAAQWTEIVIELEGSGGLNRLTLSESTLAGASDSTGPLIDRISLRPILEPEPPVLDVNLLTNGELEAGRSSGWGTVLTLDGWQSTNPVEVWASGHTGVDTTDGGNLVEIDFNGSGEVDAIWQDVPTANGARYEITFQMRSRSGAPSGADEALCVSWRNQPVAGGCFNAIGVGQWTTHSVEVVGSGSVDRLTFSESLVPAANDGTGPLLDNVSVKRL